MKKESITLSKEDFSFVCPLRTEDMSVVDGGYFCGKCEKKVHDVTNMGQEDFQTLKRNSENLCVTIHKVVAVSLVLGLSACSSSKPLTGKIASNSPCDANVTAYPTKNRWAPAPVVDKNQTITIDHVAEPQIAGGMMVPEEILESVKEPQSKEKK